VISQKRLERSVMERLERFERNDWNDWNWLLFIGERGIGCVLEQPFYADKTRSKPRDRAIYTIFYF
jgi:hypothetical protein